MKSRNKLNLEKSNICPSAPVATTNFNFEDNTKDNIEIMNNIDLEKMNQESQILDDEKEINAAKEESLPWTPDAFKFNPQFYASCRLGSNSSAIDISPGQWVWCVLGARSGTGGEKWFFSP